MFRTLLDWFEMAVGFVAFCVIFTAKALWSLTE